MPRKRYVCKNNKRSRAARAREKKKQEKKEESASVLNNFLVELEDSDDEIVMADAGSSNASWDQRNSPENSFNVENEMNHGDELPPLLFERGEAEPNSNTAKRPPHCGHSTCTKTTSSDSEEFIVTSEPSNQKEDVNDALVWGAMVVGIGFSQLDEMMSVLDVPIMGHNKYKSHETRVGNAWEEIFFQKMKENADEEKRLALEKGNMFHGVPFITVIGDGGWAKRSYGHGMNSSGGVGVIIGAETKKILFIGVRNKFCFSCTNPKKKNAEHVCYKNYTGPSTGMESSIIVEGFRRSEEDYGLIYKNYIGDGDSSMYAKIQEGCSYGRYIQKIECTNHVTRALNDNLHKVAENTQFPLSSWKLLSKPAPGETVSRLERIVKGVRTAIKGAGVNRNAQDMVNLRATLKNAPDHVFGNHNKCGTFCKRKELNEENVLPEIDVVVMSKIRTLIGNVESKAESLVFNETTNIAERYMGCVAKFTGGKRMVLSKGGVLGQDLHTLQDLAGI
ncbi:uncharacterized protein LOC120350228 [Nilaparvata lugens]|uniref:uncharacterized protein LOC120350228 n=1 Tax=Nilaparvata lugens TaxID=108931 RepID=UPI00193CBBB7|nr:uncharacterized protein LOC120350228 [Nilaparvata lugens]